jgi:hypothetical protein
MVSKIVLMCCYPGTIYGTKQASRIVLHDDSISVPCEARHIGMIHAYLVEFGIFCSRGFSLVALPPRPLKQVGLRPLRKTGFRLEVSHFEEFGGRSIVGVWINWSFPTDNGVEFVWVPN